MEHRSNRQFRLSPARRFPARRGSARILGVLLGLSALLAAGAAGYAIYSLTRPAPSGAGGAANTTGSGIAATDSVEEILGAVQVYVRDKQYAQATTVLESAAAQFPNDQELHLALGDLYMLQGRTSDAYSQYVAGIEIGPSSARAEFTAGTLANMLGRPDVAEMHYSASMRMDPSNPDTPIYLAAIQMKTNRLEDAKMNLALAARLAPDRARIFAMRGEIALRENRGEIALEQIRKAREIEPLTLSWIVLEARALKRLGRAQDAVDLLTALGQDQLEQVETVSVLAECLGMVGRPGDAASRYMDLASRHPQDDSIAFETAVWLERAGEREKAVEWAQRAQRLGNPQAGGWIDSLP